MQTNRKSNEKAVIFSFVFNLLVAAIAAVVIAVVLIGVCHTAIFMIANWGILFNILTPTVTFVLAIGVIVARHPVHSLLCLIAVFFNTVLLYLSVQAEFLALIFLIVYVGAIAILFLFVIMLLNVRELTDASAIIEERYVGEILGVTLGFGVSFGHFAATYMRNFLIKSHVVEFATESTSSSALVHFVNYRFLDIQLFSELLYTHYSYSFMLTALLLLTAMLGAIILATSTTDIDEN